MLLNEEPIIHRSSSAKDGIFSFTVAPGFGAATLSLRARHGKEEYDVFAQPDLKKLESEFQRNRNTPFQVANVPLFPLANRLRPSDGETSLGHLFTANVEGIPVRMQANHQAEGQGTLPHHLHGLLFDRRPVPDSSSDTSGATYSARFQRFFGGLWTGDAEVEIRQSIDAGAFIYSIEARNSGAVPFPAGFGSHPYFLFPSGDPSASRLVIPSKKRARIDNFANVLPDGTWVPLEPGDPFNFNAGEEGKILGKYLDTFYALDPTYSPTIELRDEKARKTYRLTGLTPNIIGAQVYYPGKGSVIALELVTHLPDPRRDLWKEPTGMQILKPGESARYAYRVEVLG